MKLIKISLLSIVLAGCASKAPTVLTNPDPSLSPKEVAYHALGKELVETPLKMPESGVDTGGIYIYRVPFEQEGEISIKRSFAEHCFSAGGQIVDGAIGFACETPDHGVLYSYQTKWNKKLNKLDLFIYFVRGWNFSDPVYIKYAKEKMANFRSGVAMVKAGNVRYEQQKTNEAAMSMLSDYNKERPLIESIGARICMNVNGVPVYGISQGTVGRDGNIQIQIARVNSFVPVAYKNQRLIPGVLIIDSGINWKMCD
ncbi:TPA: hypothetical protein ACOLX2_003198 [Vibrio parahaemolyticus]